MKFKVIRNGHDKFRWQQKAWGWITHCDVFGRPKEFDTLQAAITDIEQHVKNVNWKTVYTLTVKI